MKKRFAALLLAALTLLSLCACSSGEGSSDAFGKFTTVTLDGAEVSEAVFEDADITMVNIWATFCSPCLREMPDIAEIADEYAGRGLRVIGIITDVADSKGNAIASQLELAKSIVEQTGASYTHLLPSVSLNDARLSSVQYVPETYFVDSDGNILGKSYIGSKSKAEWIAIIEKLLGEVK